ncbi:Asp23/Gls24 family envelope stress response protein [Victivallis sp. Marseille-Q1083]|uniref:Asp23/Gls24 family envelope stress response protein n=1 Tax=Victivallis sp. Marseille-Q1083 TaxID=2717288 RepID=UPI00158A6C6F|nr:Asp23/Gls24 family envelope stress response protein [Victivallis sp. Marseille-Q1083]
MKEAQEAKRPAKSPTAVVEQTSELGSVQIHDNVISSLVRRAALNVEGVSRLAGSTFVDNIAEIVGSRKIQDRAITIIKQEEGAPKVAVEVKLNIKIGFKVPVVAEAVQRAVIEQVEATTGTTVTEVNVLVQEIEELPEETPETEAE